MFSKSLLHKKCFFQENVFRNKILKRLTKGVVLFYPKKEKEKEKVWFYFVDNVLVRVKNVFLPNCPLILSLLESRSVGVF